jgi:Holliday junction DNA helicase RuvA
MIGRLRGILVYKQPPALMIDAQGVGYEMEASLSTFTELPEVGSEVTLFTHLVVREDAHTLYGFAHLDERALFRSLIKVSGIGAKLALLILSGMNVDAFGRCVQDGDAAALVKLPGIGKKTAERLIIEMRDRIGELNLGPGRILNAGNALPSPAFNAVDDAISALVALGYKLPEATRMVRSVAREGLDNEELIRLALQSTVRAT